MMSTNESTSEQKYKSIESASVTKAEPVTVTDNGKISTIGEEFAEIYKSCHTMMIETNNNNKEYKKILSSRMNALYDGIIDAKNTKMDEIVILAQSYLFMSYKCLDGDDEEIMLAESGITKCLELLKEKELNPKCILTAVDAYHNLGLFHSKRNNKELSLSAYNEALQIYLVYTYDGIYQAPHDVTSYYKNKSLDLKDVLDEKTAINMKALLNQYMNLDILNDMDMYILKDINIDQIITCQHKILKKKLDNLSSSTDYCTWATIAGSLSEYFVTHLRFTEARDHLAVASLILNKYDQHINNEQDDSVEYEMHTSPEIYEKYQLTIVNVAKYWARYGIHILRLSQEKILYSTENKCAVCNLDSSLVKSEKEFNKLLIFVNRKKDLEEFIAMIADKYITDYAEANAIFETVIKLLNKAKTYYTPEVSVIIHMMIILNISQMHKYFIFYANENNKLMLYEQRITTLLTVLEIMIRKLNIYNWSIFFEAVIAVNDILNAIHEDFQAQHNQLKKSTTESIKKMPIEINKILKNCIKMFRSLHHIITNGLLD